MPECEKCNKNFDTEQGLRSHTGQVHSRPYDNKEILHELYNEEKLSMNEIAQKLGCHELTVLKYMKKHGIERRSRSEAVYLTTLDQLPQYHTHYKGHERWRTRVNGAEKSIFVHRLLAVAKYGFDELADKVVHHKNGIPWDNREENIEIMDRGEHMKLHHRRGDVSSPSEDS